VSSAESSWVIERLGRQHDRSQFDCGQPSLNMRSRTCRTTAPSHRLHTHEKRLTALDPSLGSGCFSCHELAYRRYNGSAILSPDESMLPERIG
jgi:hypothetical protein